MSWWQWILAGFLIMGLELLFPSFTVAWVGISALATGFIVLFTGAPLPVQIVLWVAMSVSFTLLWFKYLKPRGERVAQSRGEGRGTGRVYELRRRR